MHVELTPEVVATVLTPGLVDTGSNVATLSVYAGQKNIRSCIVAHVPLKQGVKLLLYKHATKFAFALAAIVGLQACREDGATNTLDWETGSADLSRVECGDTGGSFMVTGSGENVSLRMNLLRDFSGLMSVNLNFSDQHEMADARFYATRSSHDMGEVSVDETGGTGVLHLWPEDRHTRDEISADGLNLTYTFTCTHDA